MRSYDQLREQYKQNPLEAIILNDNELVEAKDKIVSFIQKKVWNNAVIGLSGGIDSALVAYLTVEAIGKEKVYGFLLPSDTNESMDQDLGELVAKNLGIKYEIVPINKVVNAFDESSQHFKDRMAHGNMQARTRMIFLYGASNSIDGCVIGTDNLTENKIGYFTKYGDGGVDNNPIEDLLKTQVWQLSRRVGVPVEIIERAPTAGLWQGQTDEGEIGMSYKVMDQIILGLRLGYSPKEIVDIVGIDNSYIENIITRNIKSQHKRETPPYPKVMPFD